MVEIVPESPSSKELHNGDLTTATSDMVALAAVFRDVSVAHNKMRVYKIVY